MSLFLILIFVATTAACAVRTAYALFPAAFCFNYISYRKTYSDNDNCQNNNICHFNHLEIVLVFLFNEYSVLSFLSEFIHRYTTIAAIARTAIRPGTNPSPTLPSVIIVPI